MLDVITDADADADADADLGMPLLESLDVFATPCGDAGLDAIARAAVDRLPASRSTWARQTCRGILD